MRRTIIAAAAAVIFSTSLALAQNAGTGSAAPSGDAAVSPAAGNPINDGSASPNRHDLGAGIASGAMNNGTTGDTIGTGHGTSSAPATGPASTPPAAGGRKQ
jgi:hypothetical protein